ncbi:hypothetical protein J0X12_15030 [Sneathiella sp. CAU 1612]|uniref:Lipoprotein n=1 Tax=Sneathiella sedimenti TaxID=2816034 RepID=A0ABS3F8T7_9PROT|nr:hypothetical protein [Sneathiella sedimenti]MBO0334938.1 hypothetical protein [Sneathiella sedimenti]
MNIIKIVATASLCLLITACNTTPQDTSIPTAAGTAYDGVWVGDMSRGDNMRCDDIKITATITNGHASGDISISNSGRLVTDSFIGKLNKNGEMVPILAKYPADVSGIVKFNTDGTTTGKMSTTLCSTDKMDLKRT